MKNGHHPRVRRKFLGPFIGASLGAFLVVLAQATAGRRAWVGCPGDFDSPPCVPPAWWSWSRVSAVEVVIGALIGAGLLCVVAALTAREHQRRRQCGGRLIGAVLLRGTEVRLGGRLIGAALLRRRGQLAIPSPSMRTTAPADLATSRTVQSRCVALGSRNKCLCCHLLDARLRMVMRVLPA